MDISVEPSLGQQDTLNTFDVTTAESSASTSTCWAPHGSLGDTNRSLRDSIDESDFEDDEIVSLLKQQVNHCRQELAKYSLVGEWQNNPSSAMQH
jgi:hypothetical protein